MVQKIKDKARARLASGINAAATSLVVEAGYGDLFPLANMGTGTVGDWFKLVLEAVLGDYEIVYVRTRTAGSDVLSDLLRAREGTTALDWAAGSIAGLRLTAKDFEDALTFSLDPQYPDWSDIPESNPTPSAGNKTLVLADGGKHVDMDGGTVTVPPGVFAKGDLVVVVNNGADPKQLIAGGGITMRWINGVTGTRTIAGWGIVTVFCVDTNLFIVTGQGVS